MHKSDDDLKLPETARNLAGAIVGLPEAKLTVMQPYRIAYGWLGFGWVKLHCRRLSSGQLPLPLWLNGS
jgi:hypothetical protein